jgi:hypothetical protein
VAVGVGVAVFVGVAVGVLVLLAVAVGVLVAVAVGVLVAVGVEVAVVVLVGVGVALGAAAPGVYTSAVKSCPLPAQSLPLITSGRPSESSATAPAQCD